MFVGVTTLDGFYFLYFIYFIHKSNESWIEEARSYYVFIYLFLKFGAITSTT